MNAETFSSAYDREPTHVERHLEPEQERLLERPNAWSRAFGHILHDYLSTGVSPMSETDFKKLSLEYQDWFNRDFSTLYAQAEAYAKDSDTPESHTVINHFNFHILNRLMLPIWSDTLLHEGGIQRSSVKDAQTALSFYGLYLFKERQARIKDNTYFNPEFANHRAASSGLHNECDTAITLLNMSYRDPDVAVLPAPMQFENQHPSSLNSDFIIIRRSNKQARGVQAKVRSTNEGYRGYDPNYVTLVDGVNDLGNSQAVRTDPYKSTRSVVAWPGLISLEYLKSLKPDGSHNLNKKAVLQAQFQAHALSRSAKPYLATASARVSERVLHDLEQQREPLVDTLSIK